jgi:hypothetical protein
MRYSPPLALGDHQANADSTPVANRLDEPCKAYDSLADRIPLHRPRAR